MYSVNSNSKISWVKPGYAIFKQMDDLSTKRPKTENKLENAELEDYLNKICHGDQQAFGQLYDATINLLYSVALRISQNHNMAEEIINETYLQIWQQAARFDSKKSALKSWLVMICRSRAIDAIRRTRQADMTQFDEQTTMSDSSALPDLMISTERECRLHEELEKLNSTQRQLLSLSFFRGFTHKELADFLNISLGTVKTQIRRSILQLKQNMAEEEDI